MQELYLEASASGKSVRLMPANHQVFFKVNGLWCVGMDAAIDATIASVIFNAYHTLDGSEFLEVQRLCDVINRVLSGKRLVIRNGCLLTKIGLPTAGLVSTDRVIPVWYNTTTVNSTGIDSLLNGMGLLPSNAGDIKCRYDATMYHAGGVRVYIGGLIAFKIQCEVE